MQEVHELDWNFNLVILIIKEVLDNNLSSTLIIRNSDVAIYSKNIVEKTNHEWKHEITGEEHLKFARNEETGGTDVALEESNISVDEFVEMLVQFVPYVKI